MKLEAGKTYVFKSEQDWLDYVNNHPTNHGLVNKYFAGGFTLEEVSILDRGVINGTAVINNSEIKYFKLKEGNQMDNVKNGDELAFIDSDGVYQECVVVSIYDGYAWVQKTAGRMNTVPCSKLIERRLTEEQLFINEVSDIMLTSNYISASKQLWDLGYRKVSTND